MFTDSLMDRHGQDVPVPELCKILNGVSLPMAKSRIVELIESQNDLQFDSDAIMIEFELCISLTFKPFLHYLNRLSASPENLSTVWISMLSIIAELFSVDKTQLSIPVNLFKAFQQLATEHLRNAVMILMSKGIVETDGNGEENITSATWQKIEEIEFVKSFISEWKDSVQISE